MNAKPIPTSHKGRMCKFPQCKNVLSVYNHNTLCHIHLNKLTTAQWFLEEKRSERD